MKDVAFTGLKYFLDWDPEQEVLKYAAGFENEDDFHQEIHMLVGNLMAEVTLGGAMTWYASSPAANLEYMTRYIEEHWDPGIPDKPGPDAAYGGVYMLIEDTLSSAFDDLVAREEMPWQAPECFYCESKGSERGLYELKEDRIGQYACQGCWVEAVDGPWINGGDT